MKRTHAVLQAHGDEVIRVQALYAAWSALAHAGGAPLVVHVFTDDAAAFAPLAGRGVETRAVSAAELRAWKGPFGFIHRVKVELMRETAARFPRGRLLYLDADVIVRAPLPPLLERIGPGRAVMHAREYSVASHGSAQLGKFRRHMGGLTFRGAAIDLGRDMWNAGVIGLDPAQFGVLDEWLEFIDAIYPSYRRGLVEQYGISLLLQRAGTLTACEAEVAHYWAQKDEYVPALRRELEVLRSLPFEASLARVRETPVELPPPARRRHPTTLWGRIRRVVRRGA